MNATIKFITRTATHVRTTSILCTDDQAHARDTLSTLAGRDVRIPTFQFTAHDFDTGPLYMLAQPEVSSAANPEPNSEFKTTFQIGIPNSKTNFNFDFIFKPTLVMSTIERDLWLSRNRLQRSAVCHMTVSYQLYGLHDALVVLGRTGKNDREINFLLDGKLREVSTLRWFE